MFRFTAFLSLVLTVSTAVSAQGVIERASTGQGGVQSNLGSFDPAVSADGRFIAFSGSLSATGVFTFSVNVPPEPLLVGATVYVGSLVLDATIVPVVVSNVVPVTFAA